ncbi:rRNA-processing protein las1 [Collariella sp. IMI 366227]|nr:rRNA-processing protein las1 [Collariella sp. IMI 366227]
MVQYIFTPWRNRRELLAVRAHFVTGLLDSHQDKQRKMSMYDVAKSVGLPATFVELRHQATHEQLRLSHEIRKFDEGVVLTALDLISASTRDSGVMRQAMVLTREILERAGEAERMEEDVPSKDVESAKAELGKGLEQVCEVEDTRMADDEEEEEEEVAEVQPAWRLYEEDAWVPKPIGVV